MSDANVIITFFFGGGSHVGFTNLLGIEILSGLQERQGSVLFMDAVIF